jgi:hypothetical protein
MPLFRAGDFEKDLRIISLKSKRGNNHPFIPP